MPGQRWEERAVSSSGAILRSSYTVLSPLHSDKGAAQTKSWSVAFLRKGNCCIPGDFFPSRGIKHSLISPLLQSLPCSSSSFHRPFSNSSPRPAVEMAVGQGRRREKATSSLGTRSTNCPRSHSCSSASGRGVRGQAALASSAELSALILLTSTCAGDHQTPHTHGTRMLQFSFHSLH